MSVAVVATYALRVCFPPRRRLGLVLPALGALLFGALARVVSGMTPDMAFAMVAGAGIFLVVLPIGCLVVGDAVLGAEVRAGTFHFTWLSPAAFWAIALGRLLAGTAVAVVAVAIPSGLAAVVAGAPSALLPMVVATSAGAVAYVSVFVMVGVIARRAVVWSLGIVLLGERLLAGALSAVAQWSPSWLAGSAYGGLGPGADDLVREGVPSGWDAVARLVVVAGACLAVTVWRLGRVRLAGPSGD